jgi:hypothetical protein
MLRRLNFRTETTMLGIASETEESWNRRSAGPTRCHAPAAGAVERNDLGRRLRRLGGGEPEVRPHRGALGREHGKLDFEERRERRPALLKAVLGARKKLLDGPDRGARRPCHVEIKFCCVAQSQAKRARSKQASGAESLALPFDGGDDQSLGHIDGPQQFAGLCLGLRPETLNNPAHSGRVPRQG